MKSLILLAALCTPFWIVAQKHDYVWMHGNYNNFYIDFNEDLNPEIHLNNIEYKFSRSLTVISDIEGNPVFYTNGCNIRNANHQIIEGGDTLLTADYFCNKWGYQNFSHGSGVTIPGFSSNEYIIFSLSQGDPLPPQPCEANRVFMHIIDMTADQGAGKVLLKEDLLISGCFQEPTANKHANGRDWWIILPDNQEERFYRWLLTPSGLEGPWIQEFINGTVDGYWYCGWSEFSPNGEWYLIKSCRKGEVLYNFDRCTGLLSNPELIEKENQSNFCATFSPDSKFLYTIDSNSMVLSQYELNALNIIQSKTVIARWNGKVDSFFLPAAFGYIQHGPNGKLYYWGGGSSLMHVMNFPNRQGLECGFQQYAIQLPGTCFSANLYYPHYRLGPIDGSSCDTLGINNLPVALFRYDLEDTLNPQQVTFTDVSSYEPTSWHWTFGDGQTSQDANPVHTYAQGGVYEVCLVVSNAYAADTFCRQVQVGATGVHTLPALPHARVWPNPFGSTLSVQLPALVGVSPEFVLYDLYGRVVKTARLTDFDNQIPAQDLPSGLYVWQLRWNGEVTQTGKVVKNDGR